MRVALNTSDQIMTMNRPFLLVAAFVATVVFLGLATLALFDARKRELEGSATLASFDRLTFERTPCYGRCPAYRVIVSGEGRVIYEGYSSVECVGTATKQLNEAEMKDLLIALNDVRFFGLRNSYRTELDGCPGVWTDNPSVILEVSAGGKVKAVNHYLGCRGYYPDAPELEVPYPTELTLLENRLDQIIGTREWTRWPPD